MAESVPQTVVELAIALLRQAQEIRMPVVCREAADGGLIIVERQLFAIVRGSDVAADVASASTPPDLNRGIRSGILP
jgi:hypothetical protein